MSSGSENIQDETAEAGFRIFTENYKVAVKWEGCGNKIKATRHSGQMKSERQIKKKRKAYVGILQMESS